MSFDKGGGKSLAYSRATLQQREEEEERRWRELTGGTAVSLPTSSAANPTTLTNNTSLDSNSSGGLIGGGIIGDMNPMGYGSSLGGGGPSTAADMDVLQPLPMTSLTRNITSDSVMSVSSLPPSGAFGAAASTAGPAASSTVASGGSFGHHSAGFGLGGIGETVVGGVVGPGVGGGAGGPSSTSSSFVGRVTRRLKFRPPGSSGGDDVNEYGGGGRRSGGGLFSPRASSSLFAGDEDDDEEEEDDYLDEDEENLDDDFGDVNDDGNNNDDRFGSKKQPSSKSIRSPGMRSVSATVGSNTNVNNNNTAMAGLSSSLSTGAGFSAAMRSGVGNAAVATTSTIAGLAGVFSPSSATSTNAASAVEGIASPSPPSGGLGGVMSAGAAGGGGGGGGGAGGATGGGGGGVGSRRHRRYQRGDRVLVCHHQSRWANLVNRYGYPEGGGTTPEEQRGPYVYVLATVRKVHFEEDAQYYTVTRADSGADQRADSEWMEPILSPQGEAAALRAAKEAASAPYNSRSGSATTRSDDVDNNHNRRGPGGSGGHIGNPYARSTGGGPSVGGVGGVPASIGRSNSRGGMGMRGLRGGSGLGSGGGGGGGGIAGYVGRGSLGGSASSTNGGAMDGLMYDASSDDEDLSFPLRVLHFFYGLIVDPILFILAFIDRTVGVQIRNAIKWFHRVLKYQARLLLDGVRPYSCSIRITGVNILVLCALWYVFIDLLRLAFFSPESDYILAVVSCVVWVVLVLELVFELFIRPEGYFHVLKSEKAFAPSTVRHIDRFHLVVECISLLFFVPEFAFLFNTIANTSRSVDDPPPSFSMMHSSLISIIGPTRRDAFYGRAFLAFIRLRIFGLVRHWKHVWINNTVVNPSWNNSRRGLVSGVLVPAGSRSLKGSSGSSGNGNGGRSAGVGGGVGGVGRNIYNSTAAVVTNSLSSFVPSTKSPKGPNGMSGSGSDPLGASMLGESRVGGAYGRTDRGSGGNVFNDGSGVYTQMRNGKKIFADHDAYLTNATNIGTALMVINSHRTLLIVGAIVGLLPVISTFNTQGGANPMGNNMVHQLQATNLVANGSNTTSCQYLERSVSGWITGSTAAKLNPGDDVYILWLQLLPVRCPFQGLDGVVTANYCNHTHDEFGTSIDSVGKAFSHNNADAIRGSCDVWEGTTSETTVSELAKKAGVRTGVISTVSSTDHDVLYDSNGTSSGPILFNVTAIYSENQSVTQANFSSFLLQAILLLFVLFGLSVLRVDAGRLVLGPLRRMLRIVSLYAKNPLAPAPQRTSKQKKNSTAATNNTEGDAISDDGDGWGTAQDNAENQLGNFETDQLINAVAKITDLLRKCWGVAGAGIISANLARQEEGLTAVFNPCVPGKSVYALFAFAAIKGFDHQLRALGSDIMILINDVAAVLHNECYRWGFGDSGQCNKNLGNAFLMVYRIGDVSEVKEKRDKATDVVFSAAAKNRNRTNDVRRRKGPSKSGTTDVSSRARSDSSAAGRRGRKRTASTSKRVHADSLSLATLPGIREFTDRALLGMLKTFASLYRDDKLKSWKEDFRLGAGVGAFSIDMIFGMDAGWAVEGAVGSNYKIDATYLSPHVNMASRMMTANKQYGLIILLSEAVTELLSDQGRKKLRHVDTVKVKGAGSPQKIYTYDARHKGIQFFLYQRDDDEADLDAKHYNTDIWNTDQDLRAMRQHVTEEFIDSFDRGRDAYIAGNWSKAIQNLKAADQIMKSTIMDQGYNDDEIKDIRDKIEDGKLVEDEAALSLAFNEMGDGPSTCLIQYMEGEGGVAPKNWKGFRQLTSK